MSKKQIQYAPYKDGGDHPFPVDDIHLPYSECYNGNILIKKAFALTDLTHQHIAEISRCEADPMYFIENYCRITSLDRGLVPFEMFDFQNNMVQTFIDHRMVLVLCARQNGKTQCVAAYITWFAIFNPGKTIAILANKGDAAQEVMDRIRSMIEKLPFFLQPGVKIYNKRSIELDTGAKVFSSATSASGIRGRSCVAGQTEVKLRNKTTKHSMAITTEYAKSLFTLAESNEEQSFYLNTDLEIMTPDGWSDFSGLVINHDRDTIVLDDYDLECTPCHRIFIDGEWAEAGTLPHTKSVKQDVYDFFQVEKKNQYYTNGVVSHNCDVVYIDEACFIEKDLEFYTSTYPVISSGKNTRIIMTSTPKGARGMFYNLWKEAKEGRNTYEIVEADWRARPDRDEKWKEETIRNTSYSQFRQEFENAWVGSTGTLIPTIILEQMQWINPIKEDEEGFFKVYKKYKEGRKYVAIADPSAGLGQDYSVCTVLDVTEYPYKIVAKYRNNNISPLLFPHTILNICMTYGNCPVLVEANNDMGGQVTYILYYELEYENVVLTSHSERAIGGLREGGKGNAALPGVRTTKKVKSIGCSNLKTLLENGLLVIEDRETIEELGTFIAKGNSYEADDECHDDTVMPLVLFSWFVKTEMYAEYCGNNVGVDLYRRNTERAMEDILPFGHIESSAREEVNEYATDIFGDNYEVTENLTMSFEDWMMS